MEAGNSILVHGKAESGGSLTIPVSRNPPSCLSTGPGRSRSGDAGFDESLKSKLSFRDSWLFQVLLSM
jgi:hypothetical protein